MKKPFKRYEAADMSGTGPEAYMPHVGIRYGRRPTLKERIFQWFFRVEPEATEVQYTEYDEAYGGGYDDTAYADDAESPGLPEEFAALRKPGLELDGGQLMEIQQALRDWKASAAYFESVSDPELIDYAVYEMEAAQKRYMYLLRAARHSAERPVGGRL